MRTKTLKKPLKLKIGKKTHTIKKITIASDKHIRKYEWLAQEFVQKIFGVKGALLTDGSSVYDFDFEVDFVNSKVKHQTDRVLKKIKRIYKVDVSDIKGLVLYKILDRIEDKKD
jgi:hypothetical protein